jgi:hypothetical protein
MIDPVSKKELPISVIIATLGGDVLRDTIAHLTQGDGVPAEILICIPEAAASNAECVAAINKVRVVKTPCRGQVSQRAVGLCMASQPFVMQLDDDVILSVDALASLFAVLTSKGPGNVVAPFYRTYSQGLDCTQYVEGFRGWVRSCHASLICGAAFGKRRMGRIAPSGIGFGVPMGNGNERVVESEWLPGGVALCYKTDLITNDYYPFVGKAFSEDLIHSVLWRKGGVRLWTALDVVVFTDVTIESYEWRYFKARFLAHQYVAELIGGQPWRAKLWFAFHCVLSLPRLINDNWRRSNQG